MATDWLNLRHWNGSQETAFQKLCGQLLMDEPAPPGSVFISKGNPDAGIEGYWCFPDDKEWAYQAKFFLTALTEIQWKQLDESVETALTSHPNLTKYTICIPQDVRIQGLRNKNGSWINGMTACASGKILPLIVA